MTGVDEILAGYPGQQADQEAFYKDLHRHPELVPPGAPHGRRRGRRAAQARPHGPDRHRGAGTRSNVIPDLAVLQLNLRTFAQPARERMLAAIQRIVRSECQATGSPRDPDFEALAAFPLTDNDTATTGRVAAAFATQLGAGALELDRQTVSEDFSEIPTPPACPTATGASGAPTGTPTWPPRRPGG